MRRSGRVEISAQRKRAQQPDGRVEVRVRDLAAGILDEGRGAVGGVEQELPGGAG